MNSQIDFKAITACGECCTDCKKKESGICRGCIESDGYCEEWAQSGRFRYINAQGSIMCSSADFAASFPVNGL